MQTELYHLRISAEASKILKAQALRCNQSANTIGVALLEAAALAVGDFDGPLIPPAFEFLNRPFHRREHARLNENPPPYGKRK